MSYLLGHGIDGRWIAALALSIVLALAYAGTRWIPQLGGPLGAALVIATWLPLVALAPSFWWCAFSLFFVARTRLSGWASGAALAAITLATAWALSRLGDGLSWALAVGVAVVAVLLDAAYGQIERDGQRLRATLVELTEAHERAAAAENRAGQLAERDRLSAELHDTVTQTLTSSLLLLEGVVRSWGEEPGLDERRVRGATDAVRASLTEARNLVHQLASPRVDGAGLVAALAELAETLPGGSGHAEGDPEPLAEEVTHAILRVAQSAAENVRRHARATRTRITLTALPDRVTLDVRDDGVGFDPAAVPAPTAAGGYGIRAMRQRVESLGGSFSVESGDGEGTAIAADFPRFRDAGAAGGGAE